MRTLRWLPLFAAAASLHGAPANYVVTLTDDANPDVVTRFHGVGARFKYQHSHKGFAAALSDAQVERLRNDARVLYIEPDLTVTINATRTFYIDWVGGSDANPGTSTASAWQRCPGMVGFLGTYTHAAGDRFIFKGGVAWPVTCFTMSVAYSGIAGTPDYYGVDTAWYSGASWTRPQFDAGGKEVGAYDVLVDLPYATPPRYITFDNIDFTGLYWSGSRAFGFVACLKLNYSQNITVQNCVFRNWTHAPYNGSLTPDQLRCIYGANGAPYNAGCVLTNCVFDGENAANSANGTSSGEALYAYGGDIYNCTFRNMVSGPLPSGNPLSTTPCVLANSNIGPSYNSYDPGAHPDGYQMNGGRAFVIRNNYFHDCAVESLFIGNGSGNEDDYVYNNVIFNGTTHPGVDVNVGYAGARVWFYHNTVVSGAFYGVNIVNRGAGNLGVLDARNNLFVTEAGAINIEAGTGIDHYTNANNLVLSTSAATSAGLVSGSFYRPLSASAPPCGVGANLTALLSGALTSDIAGVVRPQSQGWDVGASEFGAVTPPSSTQIVPTGVRRIGTLSNLVAGIGRGGVVNVDVAVIDTGVDLTHPDLNVYLAGAANFSTNATASDGNGHGTHVSGIIGARDNTFGVVGVAPSARIWPVKVLDDASGSGPLSAVLAGVDYVAQHADRIAVANMSLGGQGQVDSLRTAIAGCVNKGVVFVVAAGNSSFDIYGNDFVGLTADDFFPAAYPEVLTVSALADSDGLPGGLGAPTTYGADDTLATFSNYSKSVVSINPVTSPGAAIDVAGPGVNIYSTFKDGGYFTLSGTSMATPHVAGAVALYVAQYGRATNAAGVASIRQALIDCAEPQSSWGINPTNPFPVDHKPEGLVRVDLFGAPRAYPSVAITSPLSDSSGSVTTLWAFSGSALDPAQGDQSANLVWTTNGVVFFKGASTNSLLPAGNYTISAAWTNALGLVGRDSAVNVVASATTAPASISISAPTNNAAFATTTLITFTGSATAQNGSSLTSAIKWYSSYMGLLGQGGTITAYLSPPATHSITAQVTDITGLAIYTNINVVVTGTPPPPPPTNYPPTLAISQPLSGVSVPQGSVVTVISSASDPEDGDLTSVIAVNDSVSGAIGTGGAVSFAPSIGAHTISANVQDSAGATASATRSFTVYATNINTAPVVTITAPASDITVTSGSNVVFTATALDAEEGALTNVVWSDSITGPFGGGLAVTNALIADGAHLITASATDTNLASGSAYITVNVVSAPPPPPLGPPTVVISAPTAGTVVAGTIVACSGSASSPTDGTVSALLQWFDSVSGFIGAGANVSYAPTTAGAHTITARVTDSTGQSGSASVTINVTAVTLALSATVTTDKLSYINRETVRMTATVTHAGTNVSGAAVAFSLRTALGGVKSSNTTTVADGTAVWKWKVNAKSGGVGNYTITVNASKSGWLPAQSTNSFAVRSF